MAGIDRLAYTSKEAAEALGVSTDHVRKMVRVGELRSVRLGAAVLIPRVELERILGIDSAPAELSAEQILDALGRLVGKARVS